MKDIYVKFEGASELQGDSSDTKHTNEIEVLSFSHTVRQPGSATASTAGGHTTERAEHGEVIFTKEIDKSTSKLYRAASAGTVYPKVVVTFYRAYGGKGTTATTQSRIDYFKIQLEDVVVSYVSAAVSEGGLPHEAFGLRYGKILWEYKQHKMDGSAVSTGIAGWDLRKNVAI